MKTKILLFTLFGLSSCIAFTQTPLNFVGATLGGSTYEVCYYNNYLFAGCANTFRVYDLTGTDDTPGTMHHEERLISNIDQLLVHNGFLYMCANHAGLRKYEISDPQNPVLIAEYIPTDLSESVYDVAFYGDSLIVAAKRKLLVLEDAGSSLNYLSTHASFTGDTRIRGLDIKDTLLAYTVSWPLFFSPITGVYIVELESMTNLGFYPMTSNGPLEVYFGQNTELLHVMGGQIGIGVDGLYSVLDYSDPSTPNLVFQDTIKGHILAGGSIGAPMSSVLLNDTIYISTQGGGPEDYVFPNPYSGRVYIYDATDPGDIHYINDVYGGLYHFDADLNPVNRKMYIASEWYGILTVDVSDVHAEVDLGLTVTGGWCHGSAQNGNRLVEANEGYGIRLFDVTDRNNPLLINEDLTEGFCRAVAMDNNYIYSFYLTGDRFRVYDANTLNLISTEDIDPSVAFIPNFLNARYHNNQVAVIEDVSTPFSIAKKILLMDVSDPGTPSVSHIRQMNTIEHLMWLPDGNLLACAKDSLIVFDPSTLNILDSYLSGAGNDFKAVTFSQDTLYVFRSATTDVIAKFNYNSSDNTLNYVDETPFAMASNHRIFMTTDDTLIYITSTIDSLKALEIESPHNQIAVYNHGADFIFDNRWGVQELYYNEGYLFLNEYMGQTTILNTLPSDISGFNEQLVSNDRLLIYPNPANTEVIIFLPESGVVSFYDSRGVNSLTIPVNEGKNKFDLAGLSSGLWFVSFESSGDYQIGKLVVR